MRPQLVAATLLAAVGLVVTIMIAPTAQAVPESQIQSDCQAKGGVYTTQTDPQTGDRTSRCCITNAKGGLVCDVFMNGIYVGVDAGVRTIQPPAGQPVAPSRAPGIPGGPQPMPVQPGG